MAIADWFSPRTPLQLALERGLKPEGDLSEEVRRLGEIKVKTRADGQAIQETLRVLLARQPDALGPYDLQTLLGLFQDVEDRDCPAYAELESEGIPQLVALVNRYLPNPDPEREGAILFCLKILALYGTAEGTEAIIRAARLPLRPDSYWWHTALSAFTEGHPYQQTLYRALSDPLPEGFLAVALLDAANAAARADAEFAHPFDSVAGYERLEAWLTAEDPERYSYAHSAAATLPFLAPEMVRHLWGLAFDHPESGVQLEAAWAAAKLGRESGVKILTQACLEVNKSATARHYLEELDRGDAVPQEALEPGFAARAEFANWLAHPNELGRPPDEVEIVDHRLLAWPPERELKPFWLLRYRIRDTTGLKDDDVGVGLVGSVTFCLFSYELNERPPEDCYAIHCYWELRRSQIEETQVEDPYEYASMVAQWQGDRLAETTIRRIAELSPELKYPQRLVALASATKADTSGWVVLDGPRSRWYPRDEMPADTADHCVLMLHVGRNLLGFEQDSERRRYLKEKQERPPAQFVAAYEEQLRLASGDASQARRLLGSGSVLVEVFSDYVAALVALRRGSHAECLVQAYESLKVATETSLSGEARERAFDCLSALGKHFDSYVDALVELHRQSEVPALVIERAPHWDHNLGYGILGGALFNSGFDALAEPYFLKQRDGMENWPRGEEVGMLAEIWLRRGEHQQASELLYDALRKLLAESTTAEGSDRKLFEEWFQDRRNEFVRLFPELGEAELERRGIPRSTRATSEIVGSSIRPSLE